MAADANRHGPHRADSLEVDAVAASLAGLGSPTIEVASHDEPNADPYTDRRLSSPVPRSAHSRYKSPIRHHRRTPSAHREIKETLDARTEYESDEKDGRVHHRINQYVIKEEIGRGSYGAVHLATDHQGTQFAIKEFSKARLRKRARSNILRQGPRRPVRIVERRSLNAPLSPHLGDLDADAGAASHGDALSLIRQEIAIMKKLNHQNLVQLIEVLDDPEEDSLYIVLEMCKKGVVMKVGLGEQATPYPEDMCRTWFRDLILGTEYLHAQGVIHRDIKPDNLLLSDDDILKIVDFGVSEMFEKPDEMMTAKSAGSPAFLPPELCVARHGDVSGKAADIWSMGVTLYCLRYGRIPFERLNVMDMYEAIREEKLVLPEDEGADFVDLMRVVLEKDPRKRIKMEELREHPWVTNNGQDRLLSAEENCADLVEPPNDLELNRAVTRKMNHLLCVMKVRYKLKLLVARGRAAKKRAAELGSATPDTAASPVYTHEIEALVAQRRSFRKDSLPIPVSLSTPAASDPLYLGVGLGISASPTSTAAPAEDEPFAVVSDSPVAVDFNIYDRAYEEELKRIVASPLRRSSSVFLNNQVKGAEQFRAVANVVEGKGDGERRGYPGRGREGRRGLGEDDGRGV